MILAGTMVLSLAACGGSPSETGSGSKESSAIQSKEQPAGQTEGQTQPAGTENSTTLTIAQGQDPQTLDPHKSSGSVGPNVYRNICEYLMVCDKDWNYQAGLAESWEQTSDTTWVIRLKNGIQFSNGEPFNAEAVVWNLERAASTEYNRYDYEFRPFVESSKAIDELSVQINLTRPDLFFVEHISELPILAPAHSTEIGEEAIGTDVVGTGPYMLQSWDADNEIVLVKNPNYWGEKPAFEKVVFRTIPEGATRVAEMVNGSVDIIMNIRHEDVDMLEKTGIVNIMPYQTAQMEYIGFNTLDWSETPELQNQKVRQALNYAVDVDAIIESILGGHAERISTLWRPDFSGYDEEFDGYYTYDPEKAAALLAEAGYPDGFAVTLMTDVGNHEKAQEVTEAVGAYLTAIGLDVTVQAYDSTTAYAIIVYGQDAKQCPGLFDWYWTSKPGLYESTLTGVFGEGGISSFNGIPGYEELIQKIMNESTEEGRAEYLKEFQRLMVEDPACLYLFRLDQLYAVNSRIDWNPADHYNMKVAEMKLK